MCGDVDVAIWRCGDVEVWAHPHRWGEGHGYKCHIIII